MGLKCKLGFHNWEKVESKKEGETAQFKCKECGKTKEAGK